MSALQNKYSYCLNNPLKYTDPSGWAWSPISALNHNQMMVWKNKMYLSQVQMMAERNRVMPEPCYNVGANKLKMNGNNADGGYADTYIERAFWLNGLKYLIKALGVIPDGGDDKDGDYEVDENEEDCQQKITTAEQLLKYELMKSIGTRITFEDLKIFLPKLPDKSGYIDYFEKIDGGFKIKRTILGSIVIPSDAEVKIHEVKWISDGTSKTDYEVLQLNFNFEVYGEHKTIYLNGNAYTPYYSNYMFDWVKNLWEGASWWD